MNSDHMFFSPKHGGPVSTNKAASPSMFFGVVWHQVLHLHHLCLQFFSFPPIFKKKNTSTATEPPSEYAVWKKKERQEL